jgi:hypothetical protein
VLNVSCQKDGVVDLDLKNVKKSLTLPFGTDEDDFAELDRDNDNNLVLWTPVREGLPIVLVTPISMDNDQVVISGEPEVVELLSAKYFVPANSRTSLDYGNGVIFDIDYIVD